MSRFVRVVGIVAVPDGDDERRAGELRDRADALLPPGVAAGIVPTAAGLQVTLTGRYRRFPGSHRRTVRSLARHLDTVLCG